MHTASIPAQVPLGPLRSKRVLALATDGTLVEQIRRGNEAAFSVAFERHADGLLGFCRYMLGSPEEAEDAVQHTFVAAFRDLARTDERELALKPWLYAIARNRCLSMLRTRREQTALDFDLPTEGLTAQVQRRADLRDLLRDLRELPEDQRAALLLSEAGDLTHAEVASVMGCEVANVKALVFRARSGLIQRREARETPCADIREQLANLQGSSLRRNGLRHHLRSCAGCRAYSEQVKHQRQMLRAALPVVPSLELKSGVLAAAGLGGGTAGGGVVAGVGAGLSASLGTSTLVQVAAMGALLGAGVASVKALVDDADRLPVSSPQAAAQATASFRPESGAPALAKPPVMSGAQPNDPRVVDRGRDPRAAPQRSGAAPSSTPGRPDGHPELGRDQNANPAPLFEEDPPTGTVRRHDESDAGVAPESDGRGSTAAPPAGTQVHGGPPSSAPDRRGPPGGAPDRGRAPASAPVEHPAPGVAPTQHAPPGPTPNVEPRANPTAPEPAPVTAPRSAPVSQPPPAPGPAEQEKGPPE